jgi:hypothetical protein
MPAITELDYIELIDFTGRQWHAGKRGIIEARKPRALTNAMRLVISSSNRELQ